MNVSAEQFGQAVVARSREVPVVVDFWAPWCGPCRQLGPILERLAAESEGHWELAKVNVDEAQALASAHGVQGIPAVMAFQDGEVVAQFTGARPESFVREWLSGIVPSEFDEALHAALQLDHDERVAALEALAAQYPDSPRVRLELAGALIASDPERARVLADDTRGVSNELQPLFRRVHLALEAAGHDVEELERAVAANPMDHDARWGLAHALAGQGHYDQALEHLLFIVGADRGFRDDGARKAMLRIFEVIGIRSALSDRWRDELAKVLF